MHVTTTLDATFARGDGKNHHFRLKDFDTSKTAEDVKASLTKLTKLDLFEKDGVRLFKEVLGAKVILKKVTPIFDSGAKTKRKPKAKDPLTQLMEAAGVTSQEIAPETRPASVPEKRERQGKASASAPTAIANSRIPEDLSIVEERPKPGWLIQKISLPAGADPRELTEQQAFMLILACLPPHASLEDVDVDDTTNPVRLLVTARVEEPQEISISANKDSPIKKPKKKRKRLLDRVRRREYA
ncbi:MULTISPECIES: DUF2922 family protein [unclassified Enterococcus]|uniref:DUF2922 family protein n=1 Tax=unclassified Enterococcus TaxID=2608891 RepID=UPI000A359F1B|nr:MULTISPECIES: DUF2922 family protein [unclassified Enterococcus]OTO76888.1 hypothetical protein A5865_000747 [Enterococcus sp. 12E11_DIV0728]OUZ16952.1 hypothetical protein A5868_001890 [Enterococcus sp. 12F9_DIV0723]